MLTYENLLEKALEALPEFKEKYEEEIKSDMFIDVDSGNHTIFSIVFVPLLCDAIRKGNKSVYTRFLDFLEQMSLSKDQLVGQVCDYTVLEELYSELGDDNLIYPLLGEDTKKGYLAIREWTY